MRKEISPELYNYNKFPGPEFRQIATKIVADKFEFELVENHKEAFDLTAFHQRFSEILSKFDYIVGDWGNDQLRLRGFYKDEKANDNAEKISRLEDYLLEYCNYGCAYFVLENLEPRRASFDKKSHHKKDSEGKNRSSRTKRSKDRQQKREREDQQRSRQKSSKSKQNKSNRQNRQSKRSADSKAQRHFVIRQK